jgi:hypothetical protein
VLKADAQPQTKPYFGAIAIMPYIHNRAEIDKNRTVKFVFDFSRQGGGFPFEDTLIPAIFCFAGFAGESKPFESAPERPMIRKLSRIINPKAKITSPTSSSPQPIAGDNMYSNCIFLHSFSLTV